VDGCAPARGGSAAWTRDRWFGASMLSGLGRIRLSENRGGAEMVMGADVVSGGITEPAELGGSLKSGIRMEVFELSALPTLGLGDIGKGSGFS
jgi:hypothetical protein